ncbi:hypothetical protein Tco_0980787 [Tanacetum coccineum]
MLKDSIDNGPYQLKPDITIKDTDGVIDIRRPQRVEDLVGQEKLRYNSDIKAVNVLLLGLPQLTSTLSSTTIKLQRKYGIPRVSIHSYYLRYAKLVNDMKMIPMSMSNMQINTKFVNHLQLEWSRFVTAAKQARNLHSVNFDQLYAFLKHNEKDAKEVREMRQRFSKPLALLANTYNPPPSYSRKNQALGAWVVNTFGNVWANQTRVIRCYNCNGEGHIANYNNAIFMENLSYVCSINDDTDEPCYDSDILSESYDEITSNSNVISYTDYMLTIGNDADNYVPPPIQKNDMMLSVMNK